MKKLLMVLLAVFAIAAVGVTAVIASDNSQPASKATAKVGDIAITDTTDMGWTTILSQDLKTANQKDLLIDVSLECGLYTDTLVRSKGGAKDTSGAQATIKVRVLVDGEEAYPGEVVFADRLQEVSAVFAGYLVDTDEDGFLDDEELNAEELQLILNTMNANSFNFVMDNLSANVHTIEVQAMICSDVYVMDGEAVAHATIGKGSVTIEAVRFIQGEDVELTN